MTFTTAEFWMVGLMLANFGAVIRLIVNNERRFSVLETQMVSLLERRRIDRPHGDMQEY